MLTEGLSFAAPFIVLSTIGLIAFIIGAYELLTWAFHVCKDCRLAKQRVEVLTTVSLAHRNLQKGSSSSQSLVHPWAAFLPRISTTTLKRTNSTSPCNPNDWITALTSTEAQSAQ